jgi:hypothetical protein
LVVGQVEMADVDETGGVGERGAGDEIINERDGPNVRGEHNRGGGGKLVVGEVDRKERRELL